MKNKKKVINTKDSLSLLNEKQKAQILRQIQYHMDAPPFENVQLNSVITLHMDIMPDVTRPMSSKGLAKWLWSNTDLYRNKKVLDIGTGCGIQGIVCLLGGAESVVFTDIMQAACKCAKNNLHKAGLENKGKIEMSDLFDTIKSKKIYDLIVFAQPYFSGKPISGYEFTRGMFDSEELQIRFFKEARKYLNTKGRILLMGWDFAGKKNSPTYIGPQYGFRITKKDIYYDWVGVQQGEFQILLFE